MVHVTLTLLLAWACLQSSRAWQGRGPTPCCLPYKFQAVVTPFNTFNIQNNKNVMLVSRDWGQRLQVQDVVTFNTSSVSEPIRRTYMDFKNKIGFSVTKTSCQRFSINYGMLEPCMPDDAVYIGSSYLGLFDDKLNFQTWHFSRSTQNRRINMTVAVTSDRCTPVMEHITGSLGAGSTDTLVIFSNITRNVDRAVFQVPLHCKSKESTSDRRVREWNEDGVRREDGLVNNGANNEDDDSMWNRDIHG